MKLKANRATFLKALAHIQNVAEKRNTIPVLANVLLAAGEGYLELTATDTEISVVERIEAITERPGATTAPASVLYEIVRKLSGDAPIELDFPERGSQLALKAGRFATDLNVISVDDFPSMVSGDLPSSFRIGKTTLQELIDRTRFAMSTEETRYYLNGIYLHITNSEGKPVLRAVATDGHRLARMEVEPPEGAESMPGVIIPRKTVLELRKLLEEADEEVDIALSETRIQFNTGSIVLTSKLIDGTFPEYERVVPKGNDKVMRANKKDFSEAVGRVSAISQERSRPVRLVLKKDVLRLEAVSQNQDKAEEELDKDSVSYDAEPLTIGFQARYLNDITDQIDKEVEFFFSDSSAPTIVKDAEHPSALYVLMPMRV